MSGHCKIDLWWPIPDAGRAPRHGIAQHKKITLAALRAKARVSNRKLRALATSKSKGE